MIEERADAKLNDVCIQCSQAVTTSSCKALHHKGLPLALMNKMSEECGNLSNECDGKFNKMAEALQEVINKSLGVVDMKNVYGNIEDILQTLECISKLLGDHKIKADELRKDTGKEAESINTGVNTIQDQANAAEKKVKNLSNEKDYNGVYSKHGIDNKWPCNMMDLAEQSQVIEENIQKIIKNKFDGVEEVNKKFSKLCEEKLTEIRNIGKDGWVPQSIQKLDDSKPKPDPNQDPNAKDGGSYIKFD